MMDAVWLSLFCWVLKGVGKRSQSGNGSGEKASGDTTTNASQVPNKKPDDDIPEIPDESKTDL